MPSLYDLQPTQCRAPLPPRPVKTRSRQAAAILRILGFDPAPVYDRIAQSAVAWQRVQTRRELSMELLFPKKKDGLCDCGCGQKLQGRQSRWATAICAEFAWMVYAVIAGRRHELRLCLKVYHGRTCAVCAQVPTRVPGKRGRLRSGLEWDHIIPVHQGGGACWLSNYRPLCTDCHKAKTKADRAARAA